MIQIRPIAIADTEAYHELIASNRQRLKEYFPRTVAYTDTLEKTKACIENYLALSEQKELLVFLVCDEDKSIGAVIFKNMDLRSKKCEFAYFIDGEHEGKGYASKAIQLSLVIAFNELQLNRVFIIVPVGNAPSINIALRNGFEHEGTLKEDFKMSDGSFSDVHCYGLLKGTWLKMKA